MKPHRVTLVFAVMLASTLANASAVFASTKVIDAKCGTPGVLSLSPALTATPQSENMALDGDVFRDPVVCTNAPGSISGALHSPSLACNAEGQMVGEPVVGTLTVTWLDNSTSTIRVTITPHPVHNSPLELFLTGKVKAGSFDHDKATAHATAKIGDQMCSTGISSYTYSATGAKHEQDLTLFHKP